LKHKFTVELTNRFSKQMKTLDQKAQLQLRANTNAPKAKLKPIACRQRHRTVIMTLINPETVCKHFS